MSDRRTIQPIIMAGGSGSRLWPLSRSRFPKQFLALVGSQTLFQEAAGRIAVMKDDHLVVKPPCIIGNEEHRFIVLEQLREIGLEPTAVILEPMGRNTAPALTLAALQALHGNDDPVLVVSPSDHTFADPDAFRQALRLAVDRAADGAIVTLGIMPDRPETGYGYIRSGDRDPDGVLRVEQFVEKPDAATAQRYLDEGCFFWNSGIFVLRASTWLAALERFRPDIASTTRSSWSVRSSDAKFVRPGASEFALVPSESIDYAVMEHCPGSDIDLRMVPLDAGWNDLGAWDAVWNVSAKDARGNAAIGDTMVFDSHDTLVHASSRLVGVIGLDNVVVVETPDAVLVTDRARSQDVKKIVNELDLRRREEQTLHRKVHRPWGWYDSIDHGPRFQVKRILVKPGASLSLQMHHHRAEHWIVVSGTAQITVGDKVEILTENQSTYIPLGQKHRLSNPGKLPLEIIEVQSGPYLGEDDIVRFDDTYGRTP